MKTLRTLLILCVVVSGIACSEMEKQAPDISSEASVIPPISFADPGKTYDPQVFTAEVEMASTQLEIIVHARNIYTASGEAMPDRVFVLQQRSYQDKYDGPNEAMNASLLFFRSGLYVVPVEHPGEARLFVLGKEKANEVARKFIEQLPEDFTSKVQETYLGYGLATMPSQIEQWDEFLQDHASTYYHPDGTFERAGMDLRDASGCANCLDLGTCVAGGPGAIQCGCCDPFATVQCDGGCYACCGQGYARCCSPETTPGG